MKKPKLMSWFSRKRRNGSANSLRKMDLKNKAQKVAFHLDGSPIPRPKSGAFSNEIKFLQKGTAADFRYNGSFQEAVCPVLLMAQCFAVMPVVNIKSGSASSMYFSWKSIRTIYSIVIFVLMVILTVLTINQTFSGKIEFDSIVPVIFYTSVVYSMICFGYLATKWPDLMQQWEDVERQMPQYKTQKEKGQLAYRIKMITIVVMTLSMGIRVHLVTSWGRASLLEHILSIVSIVLYSNDCGTASEDPIKDYFVSQLSPIFSRTSYSPYLAFVGKMLNFISTFLWTYMDVFVMVASVGLSSRFKQINDDLMRHKGEQMPEDFWAEHRIQYRAICNLCEDVDTAISKITIVSFSNNLFFICVQLLKSLKPMPSFAHAFYFWFSLIFLISRTLAVSLYSADIHDESKKPIQVFRCVPRESWGLEVKRFSEEVTNDTVALSGMKFFHLTRKLVLSVAGTIVTYELVLIQFHEDDEEIEPCNIVAREEPTTILPLTTYSRRA